eukprot:m.8161 g.8161  ORF g.8161 m.8161 type:complete len:72 (+) comp6114_c0_seq1:132-347(+)
MPTALWNLSKYLHTVLVATVRGVDCPAVVHFPVLKTDGSALSARVVGDSPGRLALATSLMAAGPVVAAAWE